MTDRQIQLSQSAGGFANTTLTNWTVNFDALSDVLTKPVVGQKDGPYFVRGPVKRGGKRSDVSIERSEVIILDGDSRIVAETGEIIEGAPPPALVHEVLRDLDVQHIIYTSNSHGTKGDRYRVVIVPSRVVTDTKELRSCIDWVIGQNQSAGVWLCSVEENYVWSQPWYLPRIRAADAPFQWYIHDGGEGLDVALCLAWTNEQAPSYKAATDASESSSHVEDPDSPIGRYNAEFGSGAEMLKFLVSHGYVMKGQARINDEQAFRLLAPGSSTGQAGVVLFKTSKGVWRAYSHHGEHDPLSHKAEDAFGLLTMLEYEGDKDEALEHVGVFRREIAYNEVLKADVNTMKGRALVDGYRKQQQKTFNAKYGMLIIEGKAVVVSRENNANTKVIETKLNATSTISTYYANRFLPFAKKLQIGYELIWPCTVYQDWLASRYRRSYPQPVFAPQRGLEATVEMPKADAPYNLFVGTNIRPKQGNCELILEHIRTIWCSGNLIAYEYVIKWLARMVQKPGEQGRTVIVLRSGEGTGKNIIFDIFDRYFGAHSVMLTKPEDMAGFNDHLGLSVFVFLNEALWGGNKSVEGTMKSTITDDTLLVERKYLPKFKARNCTHIVVATNNDWAVPVGIDDRRFFILDASESRKGDFAYFNALADNINTHEGQESFMYHLLHEVDLSAFNVRAIPEINSATKLDHKIRTADSITRWWLDVLTDGGFDVRRKSFGQYGNEIEKDVFVEWLSGQPLEISTSELHDNYVAATRSQHKESKATVSKKLAELLGVNGLQKFRPWDQADRPYFYVLPPLSDAREAMEKRLRQHGPWRSPSFADGSPSPKSSTGPDRHESACDLNVDELYGGRAGEETDDETCPF